MARDMSAEIPISKRQISRRTALAGAVAVVGAAAAVKFIPDFLHGKDEVSPAADGTLEVPGTVKTELTSGDLIANIKARMEGANVANAQTKVETLAVLEDFSAVNGYLESCALEFDVQKAQIFDLQRARFGKMDLVPLWQGKFPSEEEFLKSQIFFLASRRGLQLYLQGISDSSADNVMISKLQAERRAGGGLTSSGFDRYLRARESQGTSVDVVGASGKVVERVDKVANTIAVPAKSEVKFAGGATAETIGGSLRLRDFASYQIELSSTLLGQDPDSAEYVIAHELLGHGLDLELPEAQNVIPRYVTPKQLVLLYKQILETKVDANTFEEAPTTDRVLNLARKGGDRKGKRGPLSLSEFVDRATAYSDSRWFAQTKEYGGPLEKPVFDEKYFPLDAVRSVTDDYVTKTPSRYGSVRDQASQETEFLESHKYNSWEDFFNSKADAFPLEALAASSKYWNLILGIMRANPKKFDGFDWMNGVFDISAPIPRLNLPERRYLTLPFFANLIMVGGILSGDRQISDSLDAQQQSETFPQIKLLLDGTKKEEFADANALTFYSDTNNFGPVVQNPSFELFESLKGFKTGAQAGSR